MEAYRCVYPSIDFSRVHFFQGLPLLVDRGQQGITLPSVPGDINVYIRPGIFDPCDLETFLLLAHELVHVLQIQDSVGSGYIPGSWVMNYVSCYLASGFKSERGNCYEDEAYSFANGADGTLRLFLQSASLTPCTCDGIIPWLPNPNFCDFVQHQGLTKSKADCTLGDCLVNRFIDPPLLGAIWSGISVIGGFIVGLGSIFGVNGTVSGIGTIIGGIIGAIVGGFVGAILGSIIGGIIGTIIDFISNLFSSDGGIHLAFSTDGGDTFPNKVVMERSSEPPALAASDSKLFVGWTGTDAQLNVFASPNPNIPTKETFEKGDDDAGPSLAFAFGNVFIVWQDEDNHLHLLSSSSPPEQKFSGKLDLGETLAGNSTPGLAFGHGRLYLAWIDGNNDIYIKSSADGINWGNRIFLHERSPDGGTAALAFGHGRLYLAWTGTDDGNHVNVKSFFPRGDILQVAFKVTLNERSSNDAGPALAIGNPPGGPRLFLAWTDDNQRMNVMYSDDPNAGMDTWQHKTTLGASSDNAGPALTFISDQAEGLLCVAWIDQG